MRQSVRASWVFAMVLPAFARVAEELHTQYATGFSPQRLDRKLHKLEVKVRKPGLTARTRKSYVADATVQ